MLVRLVLASVLALASCRSSPPQQQAPSGAAPQAAPQAPPQGSAPADAALERDREDFVTDTMAFLHLTREQVDHQITHNTGMKDEWEQWEKDGPMTDARIKQFYKQTKNYIIDLGGWHFYDLDKRRSDVALADELKRRGVKNVLDFGGGPGFNADLIARAGIDVTLADLDSVTLDYGKFHAERHGVKLKYWKSDVEDMPPDKKYDVILCLDVLEHLPPAELSTTVEKLIKLKTDKTIVLVHAPFGRTAQHPMHLDATNDTKNQIWRLQTIVPAS